MAPAWVPRDGHLERFDRSLLRPTHRLFVQEDFSGPRHDHRCHGDPADAPGIAGRAARCQRGLVPLAGSVSLCPPAARSRSGREVRDHLGDDLSARLGDDSSQPASRGSEPTDLLDVATCHLHLGREVVESSGYLVNEEQRSLVIGFSPVYVRAGAILSVYSTPRQIGTQPAVILSAQLSGSRLPPPESCHYFEVAANPHVARSLGIDLDDADRIRDSLADGEGAHQ